MLKKWQQRFVAAATALGFTLKVKDGTLTADEQKQIFAKYKEMHGVSFADDKEANENVETEETSELSAEELQQIAGLMGVDKTEIPLSAKEAVVVAASKVADEKKENVLLKTENNILKGQEDKPEPNKTVLSTETRPFTLARAHTSSHLFGVSDDLYSVSYPENKIVMNRVPFFAGLKGKEKIAFQSRVEKFSEKVGERIAYLRDNGLLSALDFNAMIKGESGIDYSELMNSAGEFIVRRTDLVIAYLRTLPSVRGIFPLLSGVQNKMKAPTASFSELSQGYRKGRVFKGNVKFGAETYKVDDVMFKYNFEDMIDLEKQFIGDMNREGSSVFKWTFMEWVIIYFGTRLANEQNIRNVRGYAVPEQNVLSNPANLAADGALRAIQRAEEEFKILPFSDFGMYNSTTMLDVLEGMWDKVCELVDSTDMFRIYANARHQRWYIRAYRLKYGQDADFTGSQAQLVDLSPDKIIWVPNMPMNCMKIWITIPGNVELQEDKPNEMLEFEFTKEYEGVLVLSRWKEGAKVVQPGIAFKSKAELEANNFEEQWLFTNVPTSSLTLADSISLKDNNHFVITGNTAVTTVTGANAETVYKLEASAAGVKVNKAGAFSKISADFTAGAKGDYIKVYAELEDYNATVDGETVTRTRMTGKFLELTEERVVTA